MSAILFTNQASLVAQKGLLGAQNSLADSVERLSSGLRINRAKDDAAGLGVGENLQKQLNGVKQGLNNVNDAISMAQTAEGALSAVSAITQRIITLATQGANDTMSQDQRASIGKEIEKLRTSIQDIAKRTKYTDTTLFESTTKYIQVSNNSQDRVSIGPTALGSISVDTLYQTNATSPTAQTTITSVNATQMVVDDVTNIVVGQKVSALNLAAGTTVVGVNTNTKTVTLSASFSTSPAPNAAVSFDGNISGSSLLKLGSVSGLVVGGYVYGTGIASGTTITEINTTSKIIKLSNQMTLDATGTYEFLAGGAKASTKGTTLDGKINNLKVEVDKVTAGTSSNITANLFTDIQDAANNYLISITSQRGELGAIQNQLEYTVSNLTEFSNNLSASRSRVMDTDYASETANLTKGQILQQAATAMLAQANQMPNVILTLLK